MKEKWVVNGYTVVGRKNDFSDCKPLAQSLSFDKFEDAIKAFRRKVTHFAAEEDHNTLFTEEGVFEPWDYHEGEDVYDDEYFKDSPPDFIAKLKIMKNSIHELQKFVVDAQYIPAKIEEDASDENDWFDISCSKESHSLTIATGFDCDINGWDFHLSSNVFDMSYPDEPYYFIAYSFIDELAHGINLWLTKVETED